MGTLNNDNINVRNEFHYISTIKWGFGNGLFWCALKQGLWCTSKYTRLGGLLDAEYDSKSIFSWKHIPYKPNMCKCFLIFPWNRKWMNQIKITVCGLLYPNENAFVIRSKCAGSYMMRMHIQCFLYSIKIIAFHVFCSFIFIPASSDGKQPQIWTCE